MNREALYILGEYKTAAECLVDMASVMGISPEEAATTDQTTRYALFGRLADNIDSIPFDEIADFELAMVSTTILRACQQDLNPITELEKSRLVDKLPSVNADVADIVQLVITWISEKALPYLSRGASDDSDYYAPSTETDTEADEIDDTEPELLPQSISPRKRSDVVEDWDALHAYFARISVEPLLKAEEEVELAKRIEMGMMAEYCLQQATVEEQALLHSLPHVYEDVQRIIAEGRQAKERMINANLRLAASLAKPYRNKGLSYLDLIQEANSGIIRAVEGFDYTRGYKFSTYAANWVKQRILKALGEAGRPVRIPQKSLEKARKAAEVEKDLQATLGRAPTLDEVSKETGISKPILQSYRNALQPTIPLDYSIDGVNSLLDILQLRIQPESADHYWSDEIAERMRKEVAAALAPETLELLQSFYDKGVSLKELNKQTGLTVPALRGVIGRAVSMLSHPKLALKQRIGVTENLGEGWRKDALCKDLEDVSLDDFFPTTRLTAQTAANKVCNQCPVARFCVRYAVEHNSLGVWNGSNSKQRLKVRRRKDPMPLDELIYELEAFTDKEVVNERQHRDDTYKFRLSSKFDPESGL